MTLPPPPPGSMPANAIVARAAWDRVAARMLACGTWEPHYSTGILCMVWQTYVRAVRTGKPDA